MLKKSTLEEDINRIIASLDEEGGNEDTTHPEEPEPLETYHIYPVPGGMVILKEEEKPQTIESTPVISQNISMLPAYAICGLYLLLILSCIAFQVYGLLNPPIATVIIVPKSQIVTLTGTLQLGRFLNPITLSQSQTVPTSGKGHQYAKQAHGFITFYNGQFQSVTIAAGTILTGADGIQIITDQEAIIPSANPPIFGQTTVSSHAIIAGKRGNIPAFDINKACCATSVLAKNTNPFIGGQDERNFQTVAKSDITDIASMLTTEVAQSTQGALQGQVKANEQLYILSCTPTTTADHKVGEEAPTIQVTVSEICSGIAYNKDTLQTQVTALLTTQAINTVGTDYTLLGDVQVTVKQATIAAPTKPVVLSFSAIGTWIYALTHQEQQRIKKSIAGKTKREALHILTSLPGIESVSIAWGDETKLPKDTRNIHLVLIFRA